MIMKKTAIFYIRTNLNKQDDKGYSLSHQKECLIKCCELQNCRAILFLITSYSIFKHFQRYRIAFLTDPNTITIIFQTHYKEISLRLHKFLPLQITTFSENVLQIPCMFYNSLQFPSKTEQEVFESLYICGMFRIFLGTHDTNDSMHNYTDMSKSIFQIIHRIKFNPLCSSKK